MGLNNIRGGMVMLRERKLSYLWCAILLLLPGTAVLGPYASLGSVLGVNVFVYRALIVVLLVAIPFLRWGRLAGMDSPRAYWYLALGGLWVAWGMTSTLAWAPDFVEGTLDVAAIAVGFGAAAVILLLGGSCNAGLRLIRRGWVIAYVLAGSIALWELWTGQHLPGSWVEQKPEYVLRTTVVSTFGNPNNYAGFLLMSVPFLWWSRQSASRRSVKLILQLLLLSLPLLLVFTVSRVAVLGIAVQVVLLAVLWGTGRRSVMVGGLIMSALVGVMVFVLSRADPYVSQSLNFALLQEAQLGGSVGIRWNLAWNGLWFLFRSAGMGVGAGGYSVLLERGAGIVPTRGITSSHSFWVEVLAEYGVIVTLLMLAWLVWIAVSALRSLTGRGDMADDTGKVLVLAVVSVLPISFVNSNYLRQAIYWLYFAVLVAMHVNLSRRWTASVPSDVRGFNNEDSQGGLAD